LRSSEAYNFGTPRIRGGVRIPLSTGQTYPYVIITGGRFALTGPTEGKHKKTDFRYRTNGRPHRKGIDLSHVTSHARMTRQAQHVAQDMPHTTHHARSNARRRLASIAPAHAPRDRDRTHSNWRYAPINLRQCTPSNSTHGSSLECPGRPSSRIP